MEPVCVWDLVDDPDGNFMHIAEHGITPDEVEDVVQSPDNTIYPVTAYEVDPPA